jgi:hypothetical protein
MNMQLCLAQQSLLWAKGMNGTSSAMGMGITTDAGNNIYNIGQFSGTVDFDPGPSVYSLTAIGNSDIFLSKYDPSGNLLWVKQMGGIGSQDFGHAIVIDNAGFPCITGIFSGTTDFDPNAGSLNISSNGGSTDIFIAKYDGNGNVVWAKAIGSATATDVSYDIDVDASNNVYSTGQLYGPIDVDPGPFTNIMAASGGGMKDAFILKLDANGNYVWAKLFGSLFDDGSRSIHIDSFGNTWCSGFYAVTTDFDPGPGVYNVNGSSGYSGFILALDPVGNFANVMTFLSSSQVIVEEITTDPTGNIYTTGYVNGTGDFDPGVFNYNLTSIAANDVFVSKLDPTGSFLWAKLMGGAGNDLCFGLAIDEDNNIYTSGTFAGSADFDPGTGSYILSSMGVSDIFISKLDPSGNFQCAGAIGGANINGSQCAWIDGAGDLLVTGSYTGVADFDPNTTTYTLSATGTNEIFIGKYAKMITGAPLSYTICEGASTTLTGIGANTYSWSPATGLSATSGLTVAASPTTTTTYTAIGKGNCYNTSTLITVSVKPKPTFIAPTSPQTVICIPDSILLSSSTSNTNTIFKYRFAISPTYTTPPYYAKNPGNYYAIATNTFIGCSDSSLVIVKNGKIPPNAFITSHTYINALTPIDTVTCYQPTVNLLGASDTSGVAISWKSVATNSIYPNPASITSLNNLKLIVKRNDNNCSDSSIVALVNQDNTLPTSIITSTLNTELNCSIYTASLAAIFSPSNCTSLWKTPSTSTITNPSTIFTAGKYVLEIFNSSNGCLKKDSINIIQTNSIVLSASNNFTICKNSSVTLTAQAIGTLSPVTYSWNSGQNGNSIVVSSSITNNYFVTATSGSCIGTKSINVNIPADIKDSILTYRSCDNNTTGTILIFAKGGISPYRYSINNGATFLSSNTFTGIPFGTYNIIIKDTINCTLQTTVNVSASNNLPTPKFLASTKNHLGDTIVLVDISIPKPDSVQWVFPLNVAKIGGTMFSPVVACSDTGSFQITMKGFYGNCIINTTKLVRFAPYDSLTANYTNASGIKTFSLYPNPNTGQFNVYVEFYKKQNASIQVWDISPYKHYQQNFYDTISITLPVDVSFLQNGSYLLRVIAEFDAKNKAFIISK